MKTLATLVLECILVFLIICDNHLATYAIEIQTLEYPFKTNFVFFYFLVVPPKYFVNRRQNYF